MTKEEKQTVSQLQRQGLGYKKISTLTGISVNTVKSFCKAHSENSPVECGCLNCGTAISQTPHKKERKFCSDACRTAWWSAHPEARKSSRYAHICACCGKEFSSDRPASKYCSTGCYAAARKKVSQDD